MNSFTADPLGATATPPRRDDSRRGAHYADEVRRTPAYCPALALRMCTPCVCAPARALSARRLTRARAQFQVYHKPRANGTGNTKRASCNHCSGDWA